MPTADQHSEFFVRTLTGMGAGQGNYVGFIPFEYLWGEVGREFRSMRVSHRPSKTRGRWGEVLAVH